MGQLCCTKSVYRCRNWFPNAGTSVFILMPHLSTRCCVFIHIFHTSRYGFPTCKNDLNCNFAFRVSPGCEVHPNPVSGDRFAIVRYQTDHWLRFRHHSFFFSSLSFLLPLRRDLGFVNGFEMAARTTEKLIVLNKRRKWFHSSQVKFPLIDKSASWFLVSTNLIWIFGYKLILSNNQSRATLCIRDMCLIIGLRSLMIIQIHCLIVLKNVQHGFEVRRFAVWTTRSTLDNSCYLSVTVSLRFGVIPSIAKTSIQRDNFQILSSCVIMKFVS